MRKDRFIVGIVCLALAVWILLVGTTGGTVAPAIAIAVLGIWGVATSRKESSKPRDLTKDAKVLDDAVKRISKETKQACKEIKSIPKKYRH